MNCNIVPQETYDFLQFLRVTGNRGAYEILDGDIGIISGTELIDIFGYASNTIYITPKPPVSCITITISATVESKHVEDTNRRERRTKDKRKADSVGSECCLYGDDDNKPRDPSFLRLFKAHRKFSCREPPSENRNIHSLDGESRSRNSTSTGGIR